MASFGTPLTPTHCASVALDVATVASLGVARSGKLLNQLHFVTFLIPEPSPLYLDVEGGADRFILGLWKTVG